MKLVKPSIEHLDVTTDPLKALVNGIWCHATAPHPQMQEVANMALADMQVRVPGIFDEATA
jgi:hypothetical protein